MSTFATKALLVAGGVDGDTTVDLAYVLRISSGIKRLERASASLPPPADSVGTSHVIDDSLTDDDLAATGVTAGTYGDATNIPQVTVNAKGQVTGVTNVAVSNLSLGSAAPLMDGTADAGTAAAASHEDHVHPSDTSRVAVADIDNTLTVIAAGKVLDARQGKVLSDADVQSGALVGTDLVLTLKGGGTVTVDVTATIADLRVTSGVYNTGTEAIDLTLSDSSVISVPVSALLPVTVSANLTGDGASTPLDLADTGTAGTFGGASLIPVITTDAKGRVTSVTTAAPTATVMTGATSVAAGTAGSVPAPAAGDQDKALHGDGTWRTTQADRVFADDTSVAPASAGDPTISEIEAFAAAGSHTGAVIYYTGNDTSTDTPTYVYHIDGSGNATAIVEPASSTGMTVSFGGTSGALSYNTSKVITSSTAGTTVQGPSSGTGATGDLAELYNATTATLTLDMSSSGTVHGDPLLELRPQSRARFRKSSSGVIVEIIDKPTNIELVEAANGYVIIGDTMLQWGKFTSSADADEAFLFPTAFGGTPYMVTATIAHNLTTAVAGRVLQSSISATGFSFNREDTIGNADTPEINWFAIGAAP